MFVREKDEKVKELEIANGELRAEREDLGSRLEDCEMRVEVGRLGFETERNNLMEKLRAHAAENLQAKTEISESLRQISQLQGKIWQFEISNSVFSEQNTEFMQKLETAQRKNRDLTNNLLDVSQHNK
jgi:hypothetical protein